MAAAALLTAVTAAPAAAQTKTARFSVRASVVSDCQVSASDLNFGVYSSSSEATGSNEISVKCTRGSRVTVSLGAGASGNPRNRYMTGAGHLRYQLYTDPGRSDPINSERAAFKLRRRENEGQTVVYTVYGEVPANQTVPAGNYVDVIRVTVDY
jgi:spore coat protein U-like protein